MGASAELNVERRSSHFVCRYINNVFDIISALKIYSFRTSKIFLRIITISTMRKHRSASLP